MRPHIFPSVPRVFEKIHTAVVAGFHDQTGVRKKIVDWSLRVGYRVSRLRQAKQPVPAALLWQHYPTATYKQIREILLSSARKSAALDGKISSGGVLDVTAALAAIPKR